MRRVLPLLAAALLAAPAASAAPADARGSFSVAFDVDYDGNKPKRITKFKFFDVTMDCEVGTSFLTSSTPPHFGPILVRRSGRFSRVFSTGQGGEVVVRGEFLTRRKLEGTLKVTGDYPPREDCTSGRLSWDGTIG